jgi:hypothetical protein
MALPNVALSDRNVDVIAQQANEALEMVRIGAAELVRKRQATMKEVIPRQGLSTARDLHSHAVSCIIKVWIWN